MDAFSLLTASILLLSISFFVYLIRNPLSLYSILTRSSWKKNETAGDGSADSMDLSELIKNGHRLLDWTAELVLASPTNTVTTFSGVVTSDPKNIEHVLKTNFVNYPKGTDLTDGLDDFLGHGIFNSDGEHWKLQRKTASLEFNTRTIRHFVVHDVQGEVVGRLLPLLSRAAATGETIDLQDVLDRLAFDNVCKIAFDVDPARLADEREDCGKFARAFEAASKLSTQRFQKPSILWKISRALNLGSERRLKEELSVVNEFAMRVVREMKRKRKEEGKSSGISLLSRFIAEGDYSDEFLRDVVISFVLAGRDTTSSTMTWFFWLVSSRPSVVQKIREEIERVRSKHGNSGGGVFTLEEVREMEYLHAALSETLRVYPIVPLQARSCTADDVLPDGTAVRKGSSVMHNVFAMGRMESIWGPDCLEFRPERWLEDGVFRPRSPYRFPVFLAGPRMCLGKEAAYAQMKAVAASVMERFEFEVAVEGEREHELEIVLRMKGGLPVRVRERKGCVDGAVNV